jgi:[ribosomal protein S18]-alanine N-acetyltransferase
VRFAFTVLTPDDAQVIASWHYPPPYDFYDAAADPDDLAELLSAPEYYFTATDEAGEIVGFLEVKRDQPVAEIGLGLRPDLTGRGLGMTFVESVLAFVRERSSPTSFELSVAEFNVRAIRVYERAGFEPIERYMHTTNGADWPFVRMTRPA